jgi:alkanesulfonate monooxygenase SsuD/methylene tetrahydromethanopterin reductase-like flavin-dependent oxidoreductase (luciferase family)
LSVLRNLLGGSEDEFEGRFYSTRGIKLAPAPRQRPAPPIWVASWGSRAGLRRVARHGDGWLASAYNTTPDRFRECLTLLGSDFANALATTWLYVTDSRAEAEQVYRDVLAPLLRRPVEELEALSLPLGPADVCAERLRAFVDAGVQRVFLWPLRDELAQLERFRQLVVPLVDG